MTLNYIRMYGNPTYMRGSKTERENEVIRTFRAKDCLGTSEGRKVIAG